MKIHKEPAETAQAIWQQTSGTFERRRGEPKPFRFSVTGLSAMRIPDEVGHRSRFEVGHPVDSGRSIAG